MAYPTGNAGIVFDDIDRLLISTKKQALARITTLAAGDVNARVILDLWQSSHDRKVYLDEAKTTPGIVQLAKDLKNDQTLDVVAEFNTVLAALQAVIDNVASTFPKSGVYLLAEELNEITGRIDQRQFTPAQTATLRNLLQTLADTILL